ncbi:hypothetical protein FQN55_008991 [Onygenales sp. PD_40]|nr:hypothetical protein FQN55_008991 [Onygenales sp. PD_40]KAK2777436.1 hypothetical protein FQN52_003146 [Onygenales sp. PD_12]KAK2784233.1 hypothetical protein FQN53_008745 [Emmonsiellopsis sp. PD_33]
MSEGSPATNLANDGATPKLSSQSTRDRLADLIERASAKDAIKDYNAAAELYSQATELQAELNGEMSVENADLLYAYGKSLYNVAVRKSDVLGSKVAGQAPPAPKSKPQDTAPTRGSGALSGHIIGSAIAQASTEGQTVAQNAADGAKATPSSYFQFMGDEDFDSDSDDADSHGAAGDQEEEEDEFANAFEMLDLARVLLLRKLKDMEPPSSQEGERDPQPEVRSVQERLADIYDLQAEISLEGERFGDAVTDLQSALSLKRQLFSLEDPSVAECHYKLSLALEFSSITHDQTEDEPSTAPKITSVDKEVREEAAKHMETAIESCRLRVTKEQETLESITNQESIAKKQRGIEDVKEIISDMEQRLIELRQPPVSVNDPSSGNDDSGSLNGILSQVLGQSATDQASILQEAMKGANDLSSLVRKRKHAPTAPSSNQEPAGKRQLDPESQDDNESDTGKKAKLSKDLSAP